jgi:hypothetical protein
VVISVTNRGFSFVFIARTFTLVNSGLQFSVVFYCIGELFLKSLVFDAAYETLHVVSVGRGYIEVFAEDLDHESLELEVGVLVFVLWHVEVDLVPCGDETVVVVLAEALLLRLALVVVALLVRVHHCHWALATRFI